MDHTHLSPLQKIGAEWLREKPRRYLSDPPGFGKSRQILAAVGTCRLLVVCPAAIRDTGVWEDEARLVGWDGKMEVISYHQLAKRTAFDHDSVVFDEAHWLKNRKVSWASKAQLAVKAAAGGRVYEASGTPTPNVATELWGQLRLLRPGMPAYWPWVQQWFNVVPNKYTMYDIPGYLTACALSGCANAPIVRNQDCEHWAAFRQVEQQDWMLARPDGLLDLPPMSGYDQPLDTPMTRVQKKAYVELKKAHLAQISETGVTLEALTASSVFMQGWQMCTGISSVDPAADPADKESGKLLLLAELLADRRSPALVACYFRNTAFAVERLLKRLNKRYATFGAATTPTARKQAVQSLQEGRIDVLLGSVEVVKEGITLTAADGVFLLERSWRPDTNLQVVRRVMRRGQDKPVGVRQLVTPDSIDSGQWDALKEKRDRIGRVDIAAMWDGRVT